MLWQWRTRLWARQSGAWIPEGARDFSLLQNIPTSSAAHPASQSVGTSIHSQGCSSNHSSPFSTKVKNKWSYTPTPLYAFLCGQGHLNLYHFTVTLYFVWLCPPIRWFDPKTNNLPDFCAASGNDGWLAHAESHNYITTTYISSLVYSTHFDSVCCQGSVLLVLCKVTVKLSLYMPWGNMGEVETELHSFLTLTVNGGEWSALPRKGHPVLTEEVATWASIDTQTLWTKEKPLATAGNQSMIAWLSSTYCSHHPNSYWHSIFCWPKISIINYWNT
jgi:hypothetical protein